MCDLLAVFMSPLAAGLNGYMPILVDVGQSGFWLQVGVLLHRGAVFAFDDHIRLRERGFDFAFAYLVMHADVGVANFGMNAWSTGLHGCFRIGDHRQVFVFDFDQVARGGSLGFGFRDHDCNLVAHKADHIRVFLGGTRTA